MRRKRLDNLQVEEESRGMEEERLDYRKKTDYDASSETSTALYGMFRHRNNRGLRLCLLSLTKLQSVCWMKSNLADGTPKGMGEWRTVFLPSTRYRPIERKWRTITRGF